MAEGVEVGKAILSVIPSLSGLAKAVNTELKKSTASISKVGKEAGKTLSEGIVKGVDDASKKIEEYERQMQANANKTAAVVEKAREKQADATKQVEIAQKRLNELEDKGKKDTAQYTAAEDKLTKAKRANSKASGELTRALAMEADETKRAKEGLEDFKDEVEKAGREYDKLSNRLKRKLTGNLKFDVDGSSKKKLQAELAEITHRRTVDIIPQLSKAGVAKTVAGLKTLTGLNSVTNTLTGAQNAITGLFASIPQLAATTSAIGGLSVMAGAGAINLFSFAGSLAAIAPAALALPGILGGVAVGAVALIVALKQAPTYLKGFSKQLQDIQNTIGKNFWGAAAKPINDFLNSVLPTLKAGLSQVSSALGGLFGALAKSFTGKLIPDLAPMFSNLAKAINIAKKSTDAFANIIAILGKSGSQYLPALATGFNGLLNKFSAFLTKAQKNGDLKKWIDTGIEGLKQLGSVVGSTFGILSGLIKAAGKAGGSTLGGLADTLKSVNEYINKPATQKGLVGAFSAILKAGKDLKKQIAKPLENLFGTLLGTAKTVLPQLSSAFGTLVAGIANALAQPAFQEGLKALSTGLTEGLKAAAPYFKPIAAGLGTIFGILGQAAKIALPLIGQILGGVGKVLSDNKKPLTDFFNAVAGIAKTLGPLLDTAFTVISNIIKNALPIATQIVQAVGDILKDNAPAIQQLMRDIGDAVNSIVSILGPIIKVLKPIVSFLLDQVIKGVGSALQVLGGMFKILHGIMTGNGKEIQAGTKKIFDGVKQYAKAFVDGWKKVLKPIAKFFQNLLTGIWNWAKKWATKNWDGLTGILTKPIKSAKKTVGNLFEGIKNYFKNSNSWVAKTFRAQWAGLKAILTHPVQTGKAILDKTLDGIKKSFKSAVSGASKIWSTLKSVFSAPIKAAIQFVDDHLIGLAAKKTGINYLLSVLHVPQKDRIPQIPAKFATGGKISGPGTETSDSIFAKLSRNEYVIKAKSAKKIGYDKLEYLNKNGQLPGYKTGGLVGGYSGGGLVTFDGGRFTEKFAKVVEKLASIVPNFQLYQGGWNAGGVAASGGTHDKDALDFGPANRTNETKARSLGIAAWLRNPATGWTQTMPHIHAVPSPQLGTLSPSAAAQWQNYLDGSNGLVGNAPDTGNRSFVGKGGSSLLGILDPIGWLKKKVSGIGDALKNFGGPLIEGLKRIPSQVIDGAKSWLEDKFGFGGDEGTAASGNAQQAAKSMLGNYGFGPDQWGPLQKLWNKESGWSVTATNPGSGAYGIPQALPGNKMASMGADWRTNPVTQIKWGLQYIKDRWGNPAKAWAHSQATNWYARGGMVSGAGTGTSDSIPAWLSDGEFVVRASRVKMFRPLLEAINGGAGANGGSHFAKGGTAKTPLQTFKSANITDASSLVKALKAFFKANNATFKSNQIAKYTKRVEALKKSLSGLKKGSKAYENATNRIKKAEAKLAAAKKISTTAGLDKITDSFVKRYKKQTKKLASLAKERDKLAKSLKSANSKLTTAKSNRSDYKNGIKDTAKGLAELPTDQTSIAAIIKTMENTLKQSKDFIPNLKKLKRYGLNKTMLNQLIQLGPVDGGTAAAALVKGGYKGIKSVNSLQKQILSQGNALANYGSKILGYNSAVNSASKTVSKLTKQDKKAAKKQNKVANNLTSKAARKLNKAEVKQSKVAKASSNKKSGDIYVYVQDAEGKFTLKQVQSIADSQIKKSAKAAKNKRK